MKKTFTLLCLLFAFTLFGQKSTKNVPLSLHHHEFLLTVKKMDRFKSMILPQSYDMVTDNGVLLYYSFSQGSDEFKLMPDDEFRCYNGDSFDIPMLGGDIKVKQTSYYLRFVNKVVVGYGLRELQDGTVRMFTFGGKNAVFDDYKIKAVK